MIETRIHHIDPNYPEKSNVGVTVKFIDPSSSRTAAVTVYPEPGEKSLADLQMDAIKQAREFLTDILATP